MSYYAGLLIQIQSNRSINMYKHFDFVYVHFSNLCIVSDAFHMSTEWQPKKYARKRTGKIKWEIEANR